MPLPDYAPPSTSTQTKTKKQPVGAAAGAAAGSLIGSPSSASSDPYIAPTTSTVAPVQRFQVPLRATPPHQDPLGLLVATPQGPAPSSPVLGVTGVPTAVQPSDQIKDLLYQQRDEFDPKAVIAARAKLQKTKDFDPAEVKRELDPLRQRDLLAELATTPEQRKQVTADDAQAELDDALRRQRMHAIGADRENAGKPGAIRDRVDPMTEEEYYALSPTQRAAVDFNTMLVGAVRRDRKNDVNPTDQQQSLYDAQVEKMFGESYGGQYSPETVALLKSIGYHDDAASLGDFLGLDATIKARDLKRLEDTTTPLMQQANTPAIDRQQMVASLAASTQRMEEAMAKGTQLLQSAPSLPAAARGYMASDVAALGGSQYTPEAPLGYGPINTKDGIPQDLNSYFALSYENLAARGTDTKQRLNELHSMLSPEELKAFYEYADNRSRMAQTYGTDLGADEKLTYRPVDQFRKILGLDGGGSDG